MKKRDAIIKQGTTVLTAFFDVPFFIGVSQTISPLFVLIKPLSLLIITVAGFLLTYPLEIPLFDKVIIVFLLSGFLLSESLAKSKYFSNAVFINALYLLVFLIVIDYFVDLSIFRQIFNIQRETVFSRVTLLSSEPSYLAFTFLTLLLFNITVSGRIIFPLVLLFFVSLLLNSQSLIVYFFIFASIFILFYIFTKFLNNQIVSRSLVIFSILILLALSHTFLASNLYEFIVNYELDNQGSWRGISNFWALSEFEIIDFSPSFREVVSRSSFYDGHYWITGAWSLYPSFISLFGLIPTFFLILFVLLRIIQRPIKFDTTNRRLLCSFYSLFAISLFLGPKWHFLGIIISFFFIRIIYKRS